jgi:uncharacterized membrane protein
MNDRRLHQLFALGVILKGIDAAIESATGVALLIVSTGTLAALINQLRRDLFGGSHDLIARLFMSAAQHVSVGTKSFYAAYMLGHGLIKILLVAGLLKGAAWSYPAALVALTGFVIYQLYRVAITFSGALIVLTAFDVVVLLLIWQEWRRVRR